MHFGLVVVNQNLKTKIKTLYMLKTLYTGCSITASFAEHLEFSEKKTFTHSLWFKRDKTN